MMRAFRCAVGLLLILVLPGCTVLSADVAAIGLQVQYGRIKSGGEQAPARVAIDEMALRPARSQLLDAGPDAAAIPYLDVVRDDRTVQHLGEFPCTINAEQKQVIVRMDTARTFSIKNMDGQTLPATLEVERRYRKWYGYPAQALQLLAVPGDLALTGAVALVFVAVYPAYFVVHAGSGQ